MVDSECLILWKASLFQRWWILAVVLAGQMARQMCGHRATLAPNWPSDNYKNFTASPWISVHLSGILILISFMVGGGLRSVVLQLFPFAHGVFGCSLLARISNLPAYLYLHTSMFTPYITSLHLFFTATHNRSGRAQLVDAVSLRLTVSHSSPSFFAGAPIFLLFLS